MNREVNYEQAVYDFNIMNQEEIVRSRTGTLPPSGSASATVMRRKRSLPQSYAAATTCTSAPTLKNWVTEGKVTPVQNQGNCNSCYIFASVAALESAVAINSGTAPVKLSEQQLLECIRKSPYGGCNLGRAEWIWDSTKTDGGVVASASYTPYNAIDSAGCQSGLAKSPNTLVDHYVVIPYADEATLKCSLAANGPHSISMDFSGKIVQYKSGIFDDPDKECDSSINATTGRFVKPYNHAVTLVGYGSELNQMGVMTDYWLIKNSWGSGWGLGGYIKVARNKNVCHVGTDPRLPVLPVIASKT